MGPLKTIDRYLLREWLSVFGLVAALTVGLLLIQALFDDFRDMLSMGADTADVLIYYLIKVPTFLGLVLPVILLVSLLYTMGQLHRNNEITALRASGLGLFRITRAIWAVGFLMCGFMWYLNASLVPWAVEASRAIKDGIEFRHEAAAGADQDLVGVKREVVFDSQTQKRLWSINRYSRLTGRAQGVTVSQFGDDRHEVVRYFARDAFFDKTTGVWVFRNGWETPFERETGDVSQPRPFVEKVMTGFTEDPALMLVFDLKPLDLSFFELRRIIEFLEKERSEKLNTYAMRYYGLLADTLAPLIVIVIGVSFSMTGVRVNPAVGVSKALGLFVVYYVFLQAANALGGRGLVEPVVAACAPSVAMLGMGLWYFKRLR